MARATITATATATTMAAATARPMPINGLINGGKLELLYSYSQSHD
jgi:hypothetical protein